MNDKELITKLKALQRWWPWSGDCGISIDWEEDKDGDWVKWEDIEKIIKTKQ